MKKLMILSFLLIGGVAACGDMNTPAPNIGGTYSLVSTGCRGSLADKIQINQDGFNFNANSTPTPAANPSKGAINADGTIFVSIPTTEKDRIVCNGKHHDNLIDLDCDLNGDQAGEVPCKVQYKKDS